MSLSAEFGTRIVSLTLSPTMSSTILELHLVFVSGSDALDSSQAIGKQMDAEEEQGRENQGEGYAEQVWCGRFPTDSMLQNNIDSHIEGEGGRGLPPSNSRMTPGRGSMIRGESANSHDCCTRMAQRIICAIS